MIDGMFMRFASTFKCTISGMRCLVWENGAAERQQKNESKMDRQQTSLFK